MAFEGLFCVQEYFHECCARNHKRKIQLTYNAEVFSFNATVQNLITQPLSQTETGTVNPTGIRVFFSQQPTATSLINPAGSSAISITNADGTATFTAASQPFYQYPGILGPTEKTAAKLWTFAVDPNIQSFSFLVYVDASVQFPNGYVDNLPYVLTLDPSETFQLTPLVHSVVGTVLSGQTVTYQNANSSIASAATDGMITAGATPGVTTISAASEGRPGIHNTMVSVCQSTVVSNGTNLPSSISSADCFSSIGDPKGLPSTIYYADLYRISLIAGQTVTIIMDSRDNLDTYLILANRFGNIVAHNDDDDTGVLGRGSRMVFTVQQTGTYVIEASTFNGRSTGNYTLGIEVR